MVGGSIAGALLGAGALTGGLSWFFINKKKEEERKKKLRAIRQRRARLAALRGTAAGSISTSFDNTKQVNVPERSQGIQASHLGSATLFSVDTSANENCLDASLVPLPNIDIHSGKNNNNENKSSNRHTGGLSKPGDSNQKLNLSTDTSRFE